METQNAGDLRSKPPLCLDGSSRIWIAGARPQKRYVSGIVRQKHLNKIVLSHLAVTQYLVRARSRYPYWPQRHRAMKLLLRFLLLLLPVAGLAQTASTLKNSTSPATLLKYRVLKTEDKDAFLDRVNQLSDLGYRVLIEGKFTILHLEATPPDTYRYQRVEPQGGPARFSNWLNEQGARGYRWLSRTALLEKAPHPKNYEYRNSLHGAFGPSKHGELSSLYEEGFRPVSAITFAMPLAGSTQELYFEHELGQPAYASPFPPGTEIEVADAARIGNVMKRVDDLAAQGYRFLGRHASSKGGGIAVLMERCSDCSARYQYRHFDARDAAQLDRELNSLGKDGFRVLTATLPGRAHLLERDTHAHRGFTYRVLDAKDGIAIESALNTADTDGYTPLNFVWHSGWTADAFLVLEKETTAAATPVSTTP